MNDRTDPGARIWLRPIRPDDAPALSHASHLEHDPHLRTPRVPLSVASYQAWIDALGVTESVFAICRVGSDRIIGTTSLRSIDRKQATAETGIGLLFADDRGKGLGAEAKALLLHIAFEEMGLHAVHCTIAEDNLRSIRSVQAQGYQFAGRVCGPHGSTAPATLYFDLLRSEWEELQR